MRVQIVQMSGATTSGEIEFKSLNEVVETLSVDGWLVVKELNGEVLVKVDNILYMKKSV